MSEVLAIIATILGNTVLYATPLIFAAMGGVFSERSGVINIGLEGMMIMGAFSAATVTIFTHNPWLGLLAAMITGGLLALVHAVASVTFKSDQVVSGVAINFLAFGIATFLMRKIFNAGQTTPVEFKLQRVAIPLLEKIPYFGKVLFFNYPTVYLAFLVVILAHIVLYKTTFGLRLRAVGEYPMAADTVGINVLKIRYLGVIISGVLAGLGGASVSIGIIAEFTETTIVGQGFIALAAMIFGKWTPKGGLLACLLFGMAKALDATGQVLGLTNYMPTDLLSMMPYILTIVALTGLVGRANAPAAIGQPYEKGR